MKRMICLMICFLLCLSGFGAHAATVDDVDYTALFNDSAQTDNSLLHGKTVGTTVKSYRNMDILSPYLTYDEMVSESPYRLAVVTENGVPVGRAGFYYDNGTWVCTDYIPNGSELADAIALWGEDILVLNGMNRDQAVLPNGDHAVYSMTSVAGGIMTAAKQTMTLEEYVICKSYENQNADLSLMGGYLAEYDQAYLQTAKEYWGIRESVPMGIWLTVGCLILGAAGGIYLKYRSCKHRSNK